ncbi:Suppressor of the cold-sensitive snRNP bioproteinsis mutant brr1-1 [Perkinsus olseni]|uniref:subtilisin n=1 Tax=Perkinsus olseni TaxID=32597 RepID=A0A7J6R587_PEROL|nr:Suppressor of the cold-sensitive snRNP bioproteinsis mutant brr1-1 [Perkinsus olseni]
MRSAFLSRFIFTVIAYCEGAPRHTLCRISHRGDPLDLRRLPAMMEQATAVPGARIPPLSKGDRESERCFAQGGMIIDLPAVGVQIVDSRCSAKSIEICNYLSKAEEVLGIDFDCELDYGMTFVPAIRRVPARSSSTFPPTTPPTFPPTTRAFPTPGRKQSTTSAPCTGGSSILGTNDPISSCQSNLEQIRIGEAWRLVNSGTRNRKKAVLALVDTGVDMAHPDLVNQFWRNPSGGSIGFNFVDNNTDVTDKYGHGTVIAGVAGAERNNNIGIAGVADVKLMILKVADRGGVDIPPLSDALRALDFAVTMGASVSSHSYSLGHGSRVFEAAIAKAAEAGHVVVTAAGNEAADLDKTPSYPCSCARNISSMLCVAASTYDTSSGSAIASWSSIGSAVNIAAPGVDIYSTSRGGYIVDSGTSVSVPQVGAVAAMLSSLGLEGQEITDAIIKSRTAGLSNKFNVPDVGELDALNAVRIALGLPMSPRRLSAPFSNNLK